METLVPAPPQRCRELEISREKNFRQNAVIDNRPQAADSQGV